MNSNIKIKEKLPNGKYIVYIENKMGEKFAIADENGIIPIYDLDNNIAGIQYFDNYKINEFGDIIIGIEKTYEQYEEILANFDLSETEAKIIENSEGPFNIGPYEKRYYEYIAPTKTIDEIVPVTLKYNYGVVNRNNILSVYPIYDIAYFSNEDTCVTGNYKEGLGYKSVINGEDITPECFEKAFSFYEDKAVVCYKKKFGYIDRNKIMTNPDDNSQYANNLEPRFLNAGYFKNNEATVMIKNFGKKFPFHGCKIDCNGNIIEHFGKCNNQVRKRK